MSAPQPAQGVQRLAAAVWQGVIAALPVRPGGAALPVAQLLQQLPVAVLRSLPG